MPKGTCSINGCENQIFSRGWCNAHYKRWNRHGDPLAGAQMRQRGRVGCSVAGCNAAHASRGWCSAHYRQWQRTGDPVGSTRPALAERFWSHVNREGPIPACRELGPCWVWTASLDSKGYGQFVPEHGRLYRAHRIAYELLIGPIPKGYELHHRCENPPCVRGEHLVALTHADHMHEHRHV